MIWDALASDQSVDITEHKTPMRLLERQKFVRIGSKNVNAKAERILLNKILIRRKEP